MYTFSLLLQASMPYNHLNYSLPSSSVLYSLLTPFIFACLFQISFYILFLSLPCFPLRSDTLHFRFQNLRPTGPCNMPCPFHFLCSCLARDIRSFVKVHRLLIKSCLSYSVFCPAQNIFLSNFVYKHFQPFAFVNIQDTYSCKKTG